MLGRRQIREKIVETLYSYYQNPIKYDVLEKKMFLDISKIYHLYIYELNFLVGLKRLAEDQIEIGKNKFLKTNADDNPNQKFVRNQILIQLEDNEERKSFSSKHKDLIWDPNDELLVKTFQRIKAGKRYQDYMADETVSFEDDQKFIGKLFLRYVAENTDLHDRFEEKEMSWADDFHIANSMIQKTIGFMKEDETSHTLIRMLKDDEDEAFAKKLLRSSFNNWEETEKKLGERLLNWDIERIALMDRIILIAAITEMDQFPATASRIIINEYIDISKIYGTEKSHIFINGVLDKYTKDFNRI
ncbi:NusB antitermination factor [Epilithonimonas bovis DSM 19482]|jgi:N utilization substance protein B|uniref:NusB antitermination factor n=1 Tax=Epilithonimonas bovis DSM 19482 TaxID=1121284 RepID=A0A1U7Q0K3_9FLAO|nr:transcription antitermination factor NusB [Epilithonimonas bovis]SIT98849.1 NusB antitermination factor [Epilithonimonas bovis DSM 19482]